MKITSAHLVTFAFAAETFLAGGNGVAVRFSNRELAPLWGAGLRFAFAATLLVGIMIMLGLAPPRGRALPGALLFGLLQFAGAFGFLYVALVQIHAGLGQTLLALVPLGTLLLAVAQRQEVLSASAAAGTLLSLTGIGLIYLDPGREPIPVAALVLVLASVLCFAQALVLVRRMPDVHPVSLNAFGMAAGALVLLAASTMLGEAWILPSQSDTWFALAYVVVIGSVAVFLLHVFVAQHWTASRASYVMVTIPLVTIVLSAWLDQEPITAAFLLGGLLVLLGVYVGVRRGGAAADPRSAALEKTGGHET